jgi:hypothetical protein
MPEYGGEAQLNEDYQHLAAIEERSTYDINL